MLFYTINIDTCFGVHDGFGGRGGIDYCIDAYKIVYGFKELLGTAKPTVQMIHITT